MNGQFKNLNRGLFILILCVIIILVTGCSNGEEMSDTSGGTTSDDTGQSEDIQEARNGHILGIVFEDKNGNGSVDADEPGIAQVKMNSGSTSAETDQNGGYSVSAQSGNNSIEVDAGSLEAGYVLTTGNANQTIYVDGDVSADPIGYMREPAEAMGYDFGMSIENPSVYDNYYYELVMEHSGLPASNMKIWVIGNSMKAQAQGTITYYNHMNGTMGVYTEQTNQVVITPIMETMYMPNPFTFVEELDPATFDEVMYRGEDVFDGKDVLVFENTAPGFEATYYVWKEHHIIIKMEAKSNDYQSSFYFKDLTFGAVNEEDINYPPGAEVLDISGT